MKQMNMLTCYSCGTLTSDYYVTERQQQWAGGEVLCKKCHEDKQRRDMRESERRRYDGGKRTE